MEDVEDEMEMDEDIQDTAGLEEKYHLMMKKMNIDRCHDTANR
jgi:hypothetical protein